MTYNLSLESRRSASAAQLQTLCAMKDDPLLTVEATALLEQRMVEYQHLSFEQASALPEASAADVEIGGHICTLTMFNEQRETSSHLVTFQLARRGVFGLASYHVERGLMFSREGETREATEVEMQASPTSRAKLFSGVMAPNPSIERTFQRPLRALWPAAHVER